MRIDNLNTIRTDIISSATPVQTGGTVTNRTRTNPVAETGMGYDFAKLESTSQILQANSNSTQLQTGLSTLQSEAYNLKSLSSLDPEVKSEEIFAPAKVAGKASTPIYRFEKDLVFTVADTDAHNVLSSRLSDHTEKAEVRVAGGRTYTAEELAKEINRSVSQQRSSRRADIKAIVEDGRVLVTTGKTGDSSEVKIEGNKTFENFFGTPALIKNGEGGEKSFAVSDNILSDGRTVTSGGNRVALRYWSADGEFNDFKITTPALKNQDSLTGEDLLGLYNQAFEDQIGGAVTARFNEEGQIVFESAKGGSDSGFRLIRMGGNFTYGTNQSNSGYASIGSGGTAAVLDFQTPESLGGMMFNGATTFRIQDLNGNSTKSITLGEEGQTSFIEKADILKEFEKAGIKKTDVRVQFNQDNQLELFSLTAGKDSGFYLETDSPEMDKRLEQNLGFLAGFKYIGTGTDTISDKPGKPENPGNSGNAPGKNKGLDTDDSLAKRQAVIDSELKKIQEKLNELTNTKGSQLPDMSWIQGSLSDTLSMMILNPEKALFSQTLDILPSSRRFLEG